MSSTGNPVEFYVSESGGGGAGDTFGVLDTLGDMFPMLAGNSGDYAFGNMANVINQLMQHDPNRVSDSLMQCCFKDMLDTKLTCWRL